ncbi:hypothetical protein C0Q70_07364 [Pomacea canaliculata]|uniref:Galactosyltransferase N-terminal domain-containing protein n=1 Tax=Pomacea canaliculata TaxID=400727 RepID=A0A2T7PEU1_POMCA|nr:hypothetical protein C0Q70_07364 [Pomacea canaliculata]
MTTMMTMMVLGVGYGTRIYLAIPVFVCRCLWTEERAALNLSAVSYDALKGILQNGGRYSPGTCKALEHVALIIPYRDREKTCTSSSATLVPFLVRQQLAFTIFVVEQVRRLPYSSFIGGVLGLRNDHMNQSNGCSNYYYGLGFEDDDLEIRLRNKRLLVVRYPGQIGAYYSLAHEKQTDNPRRDELRRSMWKRLEKEGLNSLQYELLDAKEKELYTWLLVKPPPPPASFYNITPPS